MPSRSASRAVTGRSTPVTGSLAACSSRRARGTPTVVRGRRRTRAVRSRSGWPRMCCTRRASAPGRSAADAANSHKAYVNAGPWARHYMSAGSVGPMTATPREFDIVLYGATGFVGKLTAEYLARAGVGARIALAGRSPDRLRAVRDTLGESARDWPVLAADAA